MNALVDRSGTSSKCKACEEVHVNRQIYVLNVGKFFSAGKISLVYTGPAKSTPTLVKAK